LTDRPITMSVKELTTPSVKNNSFTLGVVRQYTLTETFCGKFIDSVLVFSHTRILLHCGGVWTPKPKKNETEYLRLKTEPKLKNPNRPSPTCDENKCMLYTRNVSALFNVGHRLQGMNSQDAFYVMY